MDHPISLSSVIPKTGPHPREIDASGPGGPAFQRIPGYLIFEHMWQCWGGGPMAQMFVNYWSLRYSIQNGSVCGWPTGLSKAVVIRSFMIKCAKNVSVDSSVPATGCPTRRDRPTVVWSLRMHVRLGLSGPGPKTVSNDEVNPGSRVSHTLTKNDSWPKGQFFCRSVIWLAVFAKSDFFNQVGQHDWTPAMVFNCTIPTGFKIECQKSRNSLSTI